MARVPVIWHVRDRIENDYLPSPMVRLFRLLSRAIPDVVIANSHATLSTLHLPTNHNTAVVYSGIHNPSRLQNPRYQVVHDGVPEMENTASLSSPQRAPVIGLVGRISPWKGQHIFVEAAALVRVKYPNARFQIVGSCLFGEEVYEAQVKKQAADLGLNDCLEWLGFRRDVQEVVGHFNILVHASTTGEPFGQVIVEGMVARKPVVATNGGGVPEIVQDGVTGLLVPMGDAKAMAAAIDYLLAHPEKARAMGEAGFHRVQENFTIERTARLVESIYEGLVKTPSRR